MLTSVSRATPLFQDYGVAEVFTFFDLLKILGFAQLTISDGDGFAHQVLIRVDPRAAGQRGAGGEGRGAASAGAAAASGGVAADPAAGQGVAPSCSARRCALPSCCSSVASSAAASVAAPAPAGPFEGLEIGAQRRDGRLRVRQILLQPANRVARRARP